MYKISIEDCIPIKISYGYRYLINVLPSALVTVLLLEYISREELIDIITRNGMVEEFVSWVKKVKGYVPDPISLADIDYELLLRFVVEKKLIDLGEEPEYIKNVGEEESLGLEFVDLEKKALPKKIRRKT
jgi:hypothetical protein